MVHIFFNVISSSNSSSSSSSADMQATVQGIDIIYNRTEAMLYQQAVDTAFDAGYVRYLRDN